MHADLRNTAIPALQMTQPGNSFSFRNTLPLYQVAGKPGGDQGKGMGCPKEGMSDEHMKQMHDHMKDMHGDGGMMGKGGMGAMPADAAGPAKAAPGKKDKSAAAAPADAVDHSAHHPK